MTTKGEVIDLANSDEESDTIQVATSATTVRSKRKAPDGEDEICARPRKVPKVARQSLLDYFEPPATTTPGTSPRKSHAVTADGRPRGAARRALRELHVSEFVNKMRGPVAFCQRPVYDEAFRSQYRAFPTSTAPQAVLRTAPAPAIASTSARPKRLSTLASYRFSPANSSDSEDDLSNSPRTVSRKPARGQPPRVADSDEDFNVSDDLGSDDASETSAVSSADTDDVSPTASEDESEEDLLPAKRTKQTERTTHRQMPTIPKSVSKIKTSAIKNLARMQTRGRDQPKGIDTSLPPISSTEDIFMDLTSRALRLGLGKVVERLQGRPLRVATMCSGTESPLLALQMIEEALSKLSSTKIDVHHVFSAEIVEFNAYPIAMQHLQVVDMN